MPMCKSDLIKVKGVKMAKGGKSNMSIISKKGHGYVNGTKGFMVEMI